MNIIHEMKDERGTAWAINAMGGTFLIVFKKPGENRWSTDGEKYKDPDPAVKALKRRVSTRSI